MPLRLSMTTGFGLVLQDPAPRPELAAGVLAQALGIGPAEAAARLASPPGPLAAGLGKAAALRLALHLRLLGVRVQVAAGRDAPAAPAPLFDIALQVRDPARLEAVARRLGGWLAVSADAAVAGLRRPGGMILAGLDRAAVEGWRRRVRGLAGLQLLVSDPAGATYDLLPWDRPADGARLGPLLQFLRRLGLPPCPMTGAVAAGLDTPTVRAVLRRYPDCGLVALNRDFQRFDLVIAGATKPVQPELASFLATRTALSAQAFGAAGLTGDLRIECALSRADAMAFMADYAAIGIETRPRLVTGRGDGPE